jgi:hypothetical protein
MAHAFVSCKKIIYIRNGEYHYNADGECHGYAEQPFFVGFTERDAQMYRIDTLYPKKTQRRRRR